MQSYNWNQELSNIETQVCPKVISAKLESLKGDVERTEADLADLKDQLQKFQAKAADRIAWLEVNSTHIYELDMSRRTVEEYSSVRSGKRTVFENKVVHRISAPNSWEAECEVLSLVKFEGRQYRDAVYHAITLLAWNEGAVYPITRIVGDAELLANLRKHAFNRQLKCLGLIDDSIARMIKIHNWRMSSFIELFEKRDMAFTPIAERLKTEEANVG